MFGFFGKKANNLVSTGEPWVPEPMTDEEWAEYQKEEEEREKERELRRKEKEEENSSWW